MKQLAFAARTQENRDEGQEHDQDGKEDRPADSSASLYDDLARIAGDGSIAELLFQVMRGVFDHDDGLIDQNADGNGDAGQRHDVGLDVDDAELAQNPHRQERKQDRQGQRHADDEHRADVHEDKQDGDRGDDNLMPHHLDKCVQGTMNESGAVIGGNDADALGQGGLQLLNLRLDALGDGERVFPVPHHDDAARVFAAVLLENAAAN